MPGPKAFPVINSFKENEDGFTNNETTKGMDLRDYFAAHATEEDIQYWQEEIAYENKTSARSVPRECAKWRYADEMLIHRQPASLKSQNTTIKNQQS